MATLQGNSSPRHEHWYIEDGNMVFLVRQKLAKITDRLTSSRCFQVGGKLFRLHDVFLKTMSNFFNTMFKLPQPPIFAQQRQERSTGVLSSPPPSQFRLQLKVNVYQAVEGHGDDNPICVPTGLLDSLVTSQDLGHLM